MSQSNRQIIEARIDEGRVAAMHATLGRPGAPPKAGAPLPAFWHWTQFWAPEPPERLGRDGHPAHGAFMPQIDLPRRMWAGGALEFHSPLRIGEMAQRTSTAGEAIRKQGRSGQLVFVSVTHEISQGGQICVTERQDLVFREDPGPGAMSPTLKEAPQGEAWRRALKASTTELFRYSALTFNGHRIHYDLPYAQQVEGYDGLVVHGPLLAQRLIELAEENLGPLASFSFRALAPVTHTQGFEACGAPTDAPGEAQLWVRRQDGALAMEARAVRRSSEPKT